MRVREWLTAAAMAAVLAVPGLAQSQTGTLRVSVRAPGTLAPVPGVQIAALVPGVPLPSVDLPDNEEELLAYLEELAAVRGIISGDLEIITGHSGQATTVSMICPRLDTSPAKIPSPAAVTDADGNATIANLKPGRYILHAGREGYIALLPPQAATARAAKSVSSTVEVYAASPTPQATLFLNPAATVSGRITSANGTPVANACVQLGLVSRQATGTTLKPGPRALTDNNGEYRLQLVSPGEYALRVQPAAASASIRYLPGVADPEKATVLSIEAGSNTVGIDLKIP